MGSVQALCLSWWRGDPGGGVMMFCLIPSTRRGQAQGPLVHSSPPLVPTGRRYTHYPIRSSQFIRDKGMRSGDVGALCLSSWQHDSVGFRGVSLDNLTRTRTSTRPPHPPRPSPCPYKIGRTVRGMIGKIHESVATRFTLLGKVYQ